MLNRLTAAVIASVGLALSPAAVSTGAMTMPASSNDTDDFTAYWGVRMFGEVGEGVNDRDWQQAMDFDGAAISRDLIFLTQFRVGSFPKEGIHAFELDPSRWAHHFRKLAHDMDQYVPEDFTGIVVIDYETWRPTWTRTRNIRNDAAPAGAHDHDFLLDWRDAIRETRTEEYFSYDSSTRLQYVYDTYEEMATRFYVDTINECKRLRPNAKWTYFNFPRLRYYSNETPSLVIGYGDLTHEASRINDRIQAVFDAMDVIVPSIYPQRWTVEGNNWVPGIPQSRQNRAQGNAAFIESNIREAIRLGQGKPVYPIISLRYYMRHDQLLWLNELNIRQALQVSRDAGAAGLIMWEGVGRESDWNALQAMMYDRLAPAIRELVGTSDGGSGVADGGTGGTDNTGSSQAELDLKYGGKGTVVTGVLTVGGGN